MAEQAVAVAATAHIETQHDVPPVHKHVRRTGDVFGILAASEPVKHQDSRTALTIDHIVWPMYDARNIQVAGFECDFSSKGTSAAFCPLYAGRRNSGNAGPETPRC